MLFESAHVRVTAEYGTATLWLDFPGEPVNALDLARLRELDAAIAAVEHNPFVRILVVRSAKPAGFCAGLHPAALASLTTAADRAAFSWAGQQVCDRLAGLNAATVAFLDGPCLGAGLELALACDHRLVVARPTTPLGFPDAPHGVLPCFGGSVRLRERIGRKRAEQLLASGRRLSGREARMLGLVDHAFCERRAKIELRTFLDTLERKPWRAGRRQPVEGFAAERQAFAQSLDTDQAARVAHLPPCGGGRGEARGWGVEAFTHVDAFTPHPARKAEPTSPTRGEVKDGFVPLGSRHRLPIPPFPAVVGLVGDDEDASRMVADIALRGGEVVVRGTGAGVFAGIAVALARGFITPLEADQTKARVKVSPSFAGFDRAGLVLLPEGESAADLARVVRPRCVVAAAPSFTPVLRRDPDAFAALTAWLKPFGLAPSPATALATRAAA